MTDTTTAVPAVMPSLVATLVHDYAQKGLTTAAATLGTLGFLAPDQETQSVSLELSLVMFIASCAWTFFAAKIRAARLGAALASTPIAPASIKTGP